MEFIFIICVGVLLAILPALIAIYRDKPLAAVGGYIALSTCLPVIGWVIALWMALESDR